jgi:hypothetical protein
VTTSYAFLTGVNVVHGTDYNDVLDGDPTMRNVIMGKGGADQLFSGPFNDVICGDDLVYRGVENDAMHGQDSVCTIDPGPSTRDPRRHDRDRSRPRTGV